MILKFFTQRREERKERKEFQVLDVPMARKQRTDLSVLASWREIIENEE